MKRINLPYAPEPKWLKDEAKKILKRNLNWEAHSFMIWRILPSYLYTECGWGDILKESGITWNSFQHHISSHRYNIRKWVRDILDWDVLEDIIKNSIKL